jgi:hypothetical protein
MRKIILLLSAILLISTILFANNQAGKLISYTGNVKIYKNDSPRGEKVKENFIALYPKDLVKTKRNSTACIRLVDESKIVVTERSSLELVDLKYMKVSEGKVLFKIKTQHAARGIKINTKVATIGVKGTTFAVVSDNNSVNIFLKEGNLKIEPIKGEFKRYMKKQEDEFAAFVQQQKDDYKEYKENLEKEFVEYVKEVSMQGGTAINISGNEVRDIKIPKDLEKEFILLDQF